MQAYRVDRIEKKNAFSILPRDKSLQSYWLPEDLYNYNRYYRLQQPLPLLFSESTSTSLLMVASRHCWLVGSLVGCTCASRRRSIGHRRGRGRGRGRPMERWMASKYEE